MAMERVIKDVLRRGFIDFGNCMLKTPIGMLVLFIYLFIEIYLYRVYTFSKILFYNMTLLMQYNTHISSTHN